MKNINLSPRYTMAVVQSKLFQYNPMTIVDVGAAGGFNAIWQVFQDQLKVIGFEPNIESYKSLPQSNICQYFNVALGKKSESVKINITRWPYSSSMYLPNYDFIERFPNMRGFEAAGEETLSTIPLDDFCHENSIDTIDYIKLDTEGSELDILIGAKKMLSQCLAVEIEVAFADYHKGRPVFSDVDLFLRELGFYLYDIDTYKHARSALPDINSPYVVPSAFGQILWGDALYMRDPIRCAKNNKVPLCSIMHPQKLLKQICLFDMFSQHDSAIELFEEMIRQNIVSDVQAILDLLIPKTLGQHLTLSKYRELFSIIPDPCN